jgi:hypothetical protein
MFATFYVVPCADATTFMNMLPDSPLRIIVVICQDANSVVADALLECTRGGQTFRRSTRGEFARALAAVFDAKDVVFVNKKTFVVLRKRSVSEFTVQHTSNFHDVAFAIARVRINLCGTAVAVGIVDAPPNIGHLPPWLMSATHDAVFKHGVRCLTGVFGRAKKANVGICAKLASGHHRTIVPALERKVIRSCGCGGVHLLHVALGHLSPSDNPFP